MTDIGVMLQQGKSNEWETPEELFHQLHKKYWFTIDAAATKENAKLPRFWTKSDDALTKSWTGERVFCNPPYGNEQKAFIEKAYTERKKAELILLLLPVRTETKVWHDFIFPYARIYFLKGRLKFSNAKSNAPFASCFVVFDNQLQFDYQVV